MKKVFEGDKMKIHMSYWIIILIISNVSVFCVRGYDNRDLNAMFCFGATIVSIILSVLAIMMTLLGEFKSENTKDTLERVSKQIEDIANNDLKIVSTNLENFSVNTLDKVTVKFENLFNDLESRTEKLNGIDTISDKVDKVALNIENVRNSVDVIQNKEYADARQEGSIDEDDNLYNDYCSVFKHYYSLRNTPTKKNIGLILCYNNIYFKKFDCLPKKDNVKNYFKEQFNNSYDFEVCIIVLTIFMVYCKMNKKFREFIVSYISNEFNEDVINIEKHIEKLN